MIPLSITSQKSPYVVVTGNDSTRPQVFAVGYRISVGRWPACRKTTDGCGMKPSGGSVSQPVAKERNCVSETCLSPSVHTPT